MCRRSLEFLWKAMFTWSHIAWAWNLSAKDLPWNTHRQTHAHTQQQQQQQQNRSFKGKVLSPTVVCIPRPWNLRRISLVIRCRGSHCSVEIPFQWVEGSCVPVCFPFLGFCWLITSCTNFSPSFPLCSSNNLNCLQYYLPLYLPCSWPPSYLCFSFSLNPLASPPHSKSCSSLLTVLRTPWKTVLDFSKFIF